mgnify:CR=1 FL=1
MILYNSDKYLRHQRLLHQIVVIKGVLFYQLNGWDLLHSLWWHFKIHLICWVVSIYDTSMTYVWPIHENNTSIHDNINNAHAQVCAYIVHQWPKLTCIYPCVHATIFNYHFLPLGSLLGLNEIKLNYRHFLLHIFATISLNGHVSLLLTSLCLTYFAPTYWFKISWSNLSYIVSTSTMCETWVFTTYSLHSKPYFSI